MEKTEEKGLEFRVRKVEPFIVGASPLNLSVDNGGVSRGVIFCPKDCFVFHPNGYVSLSSSQLKEIAAKLDELNSK